MAAAAVTPVNTMARLICRRFIVAPETKIIPCGRNAVKSQMLDVSRAWVAHKGRMRVTGETLKAKAQVVKILRNSKEKGHSVVDKSRSPLRPCPIPFSLETSLFYP